jgi:peptidoglycan/LPS O-acetylase OafA/YrhL
MKAKTKKNVFYVVMVLYIIFSFLLLKSYHEKFFDGKYYTYVSRDGNTIYGLITFLLGFYIFSYLYFREKSYFNKKAPEGYDLFLIIVGSMVLCFTLVITAKSLVVLALITIPFGLITLIFSLIYGVSKRKKKQVGSDLYP